jgi:putative ABC transport system permease protein
MIGESILPSISLGFKSLALHKLRSSLTVLGVVFGVGSVIVMLAIGEGARSEAIEKIKELGATNIIVRSVKPPVSADQGSGRKVLRYGLTDDDLERIMTTVPSVVSATPTREHRGEVRHLDRRVEARIVGVTPQFMDLHHLSLRHGRFLTDLDLATQAPVAVLAAQTADLLFPYQHPIGRTVRVGEDKYVRVVGVTEPRAPSTAIGGGLPPQDYNFDVYVPFTTDRKGFGQVVSFHRATQQSEKLDISQITIAVADVSLVKATSQVVSAILDQYHRQEDTAMVVPLELLEKVEQTQRIFAVVLGSIASISLLVGGIGIMNIMLATVTERTREIGIRRAVGARRRDIAWQFLCETVVLSGVGGVVGLTLGIGVALALPRLFPLPTIVVAWAPLLAVAISVSVGIIFGAYPAHRAALMDPIEALRHE